MAIDELPANATRVPINPTIAQRFPIASWTVAGTRVAFPVQNIQEEGGNRLIQRERPYRDGAKLDDTGSQAKRWTMEVLFENSIQEEGLQTNGQNLFPEVLNLMTTLFDVHETGDLVVPTIGKVRARAQSYSRTDTIDPANAAMVTFVFVEDNEDSVDFRSLESPSVNSNARRLGEDTTFDEQSVGMWEETLADYESGMGEIESVANQPGDVSADVQNQSNRITGSARSAGFQFKTARPGRDQMKDPENARVERKHIRGQDMANRATNNARRGRPRIIKVELRVDSSIMEIAGILGQPFTDLLDINPEVFDPFFIVRGTLVKVFATRDLSSGSNQTT